VTQGRLANFGWLRLFFCVGPAARRIEVYEVIEGELEVTIDGAAQVARPGLVAIVPANVRHSIKALTDGRAIIVDSPIRPEFK
jgi:quercetin dioxygenase-like cupin family protein